MFTLHSININAHLARYSHINHHKNSLLRRSFTRSLPALKRRIPASTSGAALAENTTSDEDELFPSFAASSSSVSAGPSSAFHRPLPRKSKSKTTTKSPFEHFDEQYAFVMERLGPKPAVSHPLVRNTAIRRLLHHSQGAEHLDRVVEVLIRWRSDGRPIDVQTTREVIDRCIAWSPPLINTLFADKAKYGLTIPKMSDARRILHRLVYHRPHPIAQSSDPQTRKAANAAALKNSATFAALLPSHGLRHATHDLVCCALLAQVCARNLNMAPADKIDDGVSVTRRAVLGAASARGLVSISSSLASLLTIPSSPSSVRVLPSPEYVACLAEKYKTAPRGRSVYHEDGRTIEIVGMRPPVVFQKRACGMTQIDQVDRSWVVPAVRDVVRALHSLGNVNKSTLSVFEQVLEKTLGKEDADKVPSSTREEHPSD